MIDVLTLYVEFWLKQKHFLKIQLLMNPQMIELICMYPASQGQEFTNQQNFPSFTIEMQLCAPWQHFEY